MSLTKLWKPLSCLFLASLTILGCQSVPSQKGLLEEQVESARVSTKQLRTLLNDFVGRFLDRVEDGADEIHQKASSAVVQRNALVWKINAIPSCFRAAAREDPLIAFLDVWVLCKQMLRYFEDGGGKDVFGPYQDIAIHTARQLKEEIKEIAGMLAEAEEPYMEFSLFVDSFVEESPLESLFFVRKSVVTSYIEFMDTKDKKLFDVVGTLQENFLALQTLLIIYADHLPDQLRWQAQLLLQDISQVDVVARLLQDMDQIFAPLERIARFSEEKLSAIVMEARCALTDALHLERIASLEEVEKMRVESLEQITKERIAIKDALREERIAILEAFREERVAILEHISLEREAAISEMQTIAQKTTDDLGQHGITWMDCLALRLLQITGLAGIVLLLIFGAAKLRFFRKG